MRAAAGAEVAAGDEVEAAEVARVARGTILQMLLLVAAVIIQHWRQVAVGIESYPILSALVHPVYHVLCRLHGGCRWRRHAL